MEGTMMYGMWKTKYAFWDKNATAQNEINQESSRDHKANSEMEIPAIDNEKNASKN